MTTLHEQEIIAEFARIKGDERTDVIQGIGDDCAILQVPAQHQLVTSCDTLNEGIHFPEFLSAYDIAYRALAVNLSDLAACAATPLWVQLAITLPQAEQRWIQHFTEGFHAALLPTGAQLVGGNVSRGPLAITLQVMGCVPAGKALLRSGASLGDKIYVAGECGTAALGLQCLLKKIQLPDAALTEKIIACWSRPQAQIELGIALRDIASAAIDFSDGLITDLGHLCRLSGCGATISLADVPVAPILRQCLDRNAYLRLALAGGEDYFLCFTVPPTRVAQLLALQQQGKWILTCVGEMRASAGLEFIDEAGQSVAFPFEGYQHF